MSRLAAPPRRRPFPAQLPLEAPRGPDPSRSRRARTECHPGPPATLGERLVDVWEDVRAERAAVCPICAGALERRAEHARCRSCGSTLS